MSATELVSANQDLPIGTIFKDGEVTLKVVANTEDDDCINKCYYRGHSSHDVHRCFEFHCIREMRSDVTDVHVEEVVD